MASEVEVDFDEVLEAAVAAAKEAGALIHAGHSGALSFSVSNKVGLDLVTDIDHKTEEVILGRLKPQFEPKGHLFIAEESESDHPLTDAPTWAVDPLDGTVNFCKGFPYSCVSIGLLVDRRAAVGVIYCPATNELYTAVRGRGAYLNGARIHVNPDVSRLEDAMVLTNISANRNARFLDATMKCVAATMPGLGSVRSIGSAAMCMAYVARGYSDAYWELLVGGPWDFAAGAIILEEAGGVCRDLDGGDFDIMSRRVLCGVKPIVDVLADRLRPVLAEVGSYTDDDGAGATGAAES